MKVLIVETSELFAMSCYMENHHFILIQKNKLLKKFKKVMYFLMI